MELMKKKLKDSEWNKLAEKNAKHSARIHIEAGNPKKIAQAFKDIPAQIALEFLFDLAEKARAGNKTKKAMVILEAVALIDRTTGEETEIVLELDKKGAKETATISVRKYTPAEIFASPIVFHEVEEFPEPLGYKS